MSDEIFDSAAAPVVPCSATGQREIEMCLPVDVKPFANVGPIKVKCCGRSVIGPIDFCKDTPSVPCSFSIFQRICVEVPVEFGAEVETEDLHITCIDVGPDGCRNCDNTVNDDQIDA